MRVLVSGAFGFIGTAVAWRLAADGHEVVALTSRPPGETAPRAFDAQVRRADVRDALAVRGAVAGADAICHLAGLTGVRDSFGREGEYASVNVGGTATLLAAQREQAGNGRPAAFILASSSAVYGAPARQPIQETAFLEPTSPYGVSKAGAEHAVAAAVAAADGALGAVSLRIFNAAGAANGMADPSGTRLIPNVLAVAAGSAPAFTINGDGSVVRDYVHVADVADAFALALAACAAGRHAVYNVGATPASVADVVAVAREVTGRPIPVTSQPPRNEPPALVADTALISRELGWKADRSALREIIADAWMAIAVPEPRPSESPGRHL